MIAALSDGIEVKGAAEEAASCRLQRRQASLEGAVELRVDSQNGQKRFLTGVFLIAVCKQRRREERGDAEELSTMARGPLWQSVKISPVLILSSRPTSSSSSQELLSKRLPASSQLPSLLVAQAVVTRQQMGGCCSVVCVCVCG